MSTYILPHVLCLTLFYARCDAGAAGPSTSATDVPYTNSEIQPASPRPVAEDPEDHRMIPDDGDAEQENGVEVLLDWVQGKTTNFVEWCGTHQGVVGTVVISAAAVSVAVLTTLSKRR